MDKTSYTSAKQTSEIVVAALRDAALLVGEVASAPVTLETGGQIIPGLGLSSDAADLTRRANETELGIFKVLVLGEFKNGKSTLLNAILGSKVLPAKATPATAIITVLVHGKNELVSVYQVDKASPRVLSWEEFSQEFKLSRADIESLDKTGYLDRFQNIEYAQLETQHPFCANGVRLIDSPGLGEQASRTRVTTNFLKQAHAVIFVLNATRIFSEEEKKFIETRLEAGWLKNVFFVVNRVNQIDEDGIDEVKNWVQAVLKPQFSNEEGVFQEDFYKRRVFFVNALGGLEARLRTPLDTEALEASGMPALERELEVFLTSEDKLKAVFETTVQALGNVVEEAGRRIRQQKVSLDQPLEELEKHRDEARVKLEELENRKKDIERTITLYATMVKQHIYSNLREYISQMHKNWHQEAPTYINLDELLSIGDVLQSLVSKEAEARIAATLETEVKKYLRAKLADWAENVPAVIGEDIAKMLAEVEAQIENFQIELDQIGNLFAGDSASEYEEVESQRGNRVSQILSGFGDIGQMAEGAFMSGDWGNLFGRMLQQVITLVIIFGLFSGPLAWIILVVVEVWYIFLHREKLKEKLLEKLGDRLNEELQKELAGKQSQIYEMVEKKFEEFSQHITKALQAQIDEKSAEIERIVRQKQDASFSVVQEKARLDNVGEKLGKIYKTVVTATFGEGHRPTPRPRLEENPSLLTGN